MSRIKTLAFIDGFNLYHAVADLGETHLKWLDLRRLCRHFAPEADFDLSRVLYFTAFATWRPDSYRRHKSYVRALEAVGVEVMLSKFKEKFRGCRHCGNRWTDHEEKETDVSIGVHLVDLAHAGAFDRALLISADSDLVPAVRLVKQRFPQKVIRVVTPPGRPPSRELVTASDDRGARIKKIHLERSLLPETIERGEGSTVIRPSAYDPASI